MKVVVFDLGNVITPFDFHICCKRLADYSPHSPQHIYQHIFKSQVIYDYEEGRLTSHEFFARLQDELQLNLDFDSFRPVWEEIFTEDTAVSQIIRKLKNGYRLFLLSNTNELHFGYIHRNFDVLKLFDEYILSHKVGHMKPHPHIYQQALKLASVPAEEVIYIDDKPDYAQVASDLGFRGVHFTSATLLEQDLI